MHRMLESNATSFVSAGVVPKKGRLPKTDCLYLNCYK